MRVAYIGLYTLTDAHRGQELLKSRNIRSRVTRMPSEKGVSCAFGLKLPAPEAEAARKLLEDYHLRLGRTVFRREEGGRGIDLL